MGISLVSGLMGIVGDFSLINPYGARAKGFFLQLVRVEGYLV